MGGGVGEEERDLGKRGGKKKGRKEEKKKRGKESIRINKFLR